MRILIVEDEAHIRTTLAMNLQMENYEVDQASDGSEALEKIKNQHFDLILLDVMLPEVNGIQVLKKIRVLHQYLPVIIISAKETSQDRILGLKEGADDYLVKPFNLEELLLRIEKILNRNNQKKIEDQDEFYFGGNYVNFKTYAAKGNQGQFNLTQKEMMLIKMLIDHKNEVVSRQQILHTVWDYDVFPSTRTIDNFILSFRKYFEKDPKSPQYFHSVRGIGYKFIFED